MIEWITAPWPWYVAGPMIALTMWWLLYSGKRFGVSSTLRTMCAIGGAGRFSDFFRYDWKEGIWNLIFILGTAIGGFIAANFLTGNEPMALNPDTVAHLQGLGITDVGAQLIPTGVFSWENLLTGPGLVMMVGGGFLIGFGTRYADGCTSGHAISGLSNLEWPSLVAVIGFFIGGLLVTHFILPVLL